MQQEIANPGSPAADPTPSPPGRPASRAIQLYCVGALLAFAVLAYAAVSNTSPTYDEVLHAPAAYTHLRYHDYRANPEHPPLWKYLAALPWLYDPPADANVNSPAFAAIPQDLGYRWDWAVQTLYHTPGNDADHLVFMSRAIMVLPATALGALLAWWSYRIAGSVAAAVAVSLYSLDPNFLGHGALIAGDVPFALAAFLVMFALWSVGERITPWRVAALAVCCAAAFLTKHTAMLLAPAILLTLAARALLPAPWTTARGSMNTRSHRLRAAVAITALCALTTYVGIWTAYGFRFSSTPDPAVHPNVALMTRNAVASEIFLSIGRVPEPDEIARTTPSLYLRSCQIVLDHRLLPEPYASGLIFAYSRTLTCASYALGEHYGTGRWYYFPLAFLVKTPLTTLAAILLLPLASLLPSLSHQPSFPSTSPSSNPQSEIRNPQWPWLALSLAIPFAIFATAAVRSNMNIGLRHVFHLYPVLFLVAGVAAARLYAARPHFFRVALPALLLSLAAETLSAYPNYISFFNAASRSHRLYLLGDSNLDWGQDLPALARWQAEHPDRTLYLAYQGMADPAYYKIRFQALTLNTGTQMTRRIFPTTGVAAVSATMLQTDWVRPEAKAFFESLRNRPPTEILGGSIYLYELDAPSS